MNFKMAARRYSMNFASAAVATAVIGLTASAGMLTGSEAMAQSQTPKKQEDKVNPAVLQFGPRVAPAPGQRRQPQRQQRRSKAKVVSTHGKWNVSCEDTKDPKTGKTAQVCGLTQTYVHPTKKGVTLTLFLLNVQSGDKKITMMRLIAPMGVFLPLGVAFEIDGKPITRVPYERCLVTFCTSSGQARAKTLEKMKNGSSAKFIIYEAPGKGVEMLLSLKGFTDGLNALNKHAPRKVN